MTLVRILLGALVALLVVVVAVPAVVLLDLVLGGTGLGLCPAGLDSCSTSPYALLELVAVLVLVFASIGTGVAVCVRVISRGTSRR